MHPVQSPSLFQEHRQEYREYVFLKSESPDEFINNFKIMVLEAKNADLRKQLAQLQKAILECEDWDYGP